MSSKTILISDSHVSEHNGNVDTFFSMLKRLETIDADLVFLGDVFDLWIGHRKYQKPFHFEFLEWCRVQGEKRTIGLVEGNHEFFICEKFNDAFTWCHPQIFSFNGWLMVHGDLINSQDLNYLRFRKISKSGFVKHAVRFLPFGRALVEKLKVRLESTNLAYKSRLPESEILRFAEENLEQNLDLCGLVFGHFHKEKAWTLESGQRVHAMPAWVDSGKVGILDKNSDEPPKFPVWSTLT